MKKTFSQWFADNKVLLIGAIAAAAVVIQQYADNPTPDYKIIGLAVLAAIGSYFAKNLRGQWISIAGVVSNMATLFIQNVQNHTPISWLQVIAQVLLGFLAIAAPAPKSISYERSDVIEAAKGQAAATDVNKVPPPPVGS